MTALARHRATALFAVLLVTAVFALRWPGIERKVWNLDEGSTLTMAEIVRHGGVLYRDAADNRTPLVPYLKAGILAVAGDWNMYAIHLALAAMVGFTAIGIWRALRAAGDERTGAVGAVYFVLLGFVMPGPVDVMAAHTGWFLVFFSAAAMWTFVRALPRGSWAGGCGAGLLFALATLAKQPGLLDWGATLVICALLALASPERRRTALRVGTGLVAGWVLVLAATWLYFSANDAWDDFLRYAWEYNTKLYVPEVPLAQRLWAIRVPFVQLWESARLSLLLGVPAALWLIARAIARTVRRPAGFPLVEWLVLGWAASGLASTMLSGRDFGHYTIQAMPGLALACGWISVRLWDCATCWKRPARLALAAALTFVPVSIAVVAIERARHLEKDDVVIIEAGRAIARHTKPDERIFIWGYVPELHLFAERLPATRFLYAVYLTGLIPWTNLDPLRNTDYAIVPGSWDAFWEDFEARRPAVIIDTRIVRGFIKYPLRQQPKLWAIVERDYAELDAGTLNGIGFGVFKRTATPPADATAPLGEAVKFNAPSVAAPQTLRIEATAPAGTRALDLYLDGRPYRRIETQPGAAFTAAFFLLKADLPLGAHRLRAVARLANASATAAEHPLQVTSLDASAPVAPVGPPLVLDDGTEIRAVEGTTIAGDPLTYRPSGDLWEAHAPSRLVYPRPPNLAEIEIAFGLRAESYADDKPQRTDGIDVVVLFEDEQGQQQQLFRRELRPVARGSDQGPQSARVPIPGLRPGRLHLLMTAGPFSNPAFDWAYWKHVRGHQPALGIRLARGRLNPVEMSADLGVTSMDFHGQEIVMIHSPSRIRYENRAALRRLRGEFGLLDEAWSGNGRSEGAVFEVQLVHPDGVVRTLFERTLRPVPNPADRGVQRFETEVPAAPGARLQLVTRPANPQNNAFNYTFWRDLRGEAAEQP